MGTVFPSMRAINCWSANTICRNSIKYIVSLIFDWTHIGKEKCEAVRVGGGEGGPNWGAVLSNGRLEDTQPLWVLRVIQ